MCVSSECIPKTHPTDPRGDPSVMSSIAKAAQDKAVPQPCAGVPWAPLSAGTFLSVGNEKAVPGMIQTKAKFSPRISAEPPEMMFSPLLTHLWCLQRDEMAGNTHTLVFRHTHIQIYKINIKM